MATSQTPHASHPSPPAVPLAHSGSSWPTAAQWSGASRPVQPFTRIETSGIFVSTGVSTPPARFGATMASADFPGHFLPGISPDKSVLLPGTTAAFTSAAEPMGFAVLCQLAPPRRPSMRFLSVGPPVSASLPPPAKLPSRSWLHVVVLSRFHVLALLQGTCTPFTTRPCWAYTRAWRSIWHSAPKLSTQTFAEKDHR